MRTKRGEPTPNEIEATRTWLSERGVEVETPSRAIAVRVGARQTSTTTSKVLWTVCTGCVGLVLVFAFGIQDLSRSLGADITYSRYVYVVFATTQLGTWLSSLYRERELGGLPVMNQRPPVLKVLGGWYLTTSVITFGGGAALAVAMYVGTPARAYAQSWLIGLGWAALSSAAILAGTAFRRTRAEDAASIAVDFELRFQDSRLVQPALYAVAVLIDVVFSSRIPAGFTWWLVAYAALAAATTLIAHWRAGYRPAFPPGDYGILARQEEDVRPEA